MLDFASLGSAVVGRAVSAKISQVQQFSCMLSILASGATADHPKPACILLNDNTRTKSTDTVDIYIPDLLPREAGIDEGIHRVQDVARV